MRSGALCPLTQLSAGTLSDLGSPVCADRLCEFLCVSVPLCLEDTVSLLPFSTSSSCNLSTSSA